MQAITITSDLQGTVIELAHQLHLPEMEILRQAIEDYARKIRKKQRLMSFAGVLTDTEADELLRVIQAGRVDKDEVVQV